MAPCTGHPSTPALGACFCSTQVAYAGFRRLHRQWLGNRTSQQQQGLRLSTRHASTPASGGCSGSTHDAHGCFRVATDIKRKRKKVMSHTHTYFNRVSVFLFIAGMRMHVWFRFDSGLAHGWFRCGSCTIQEWFSCGSYLVQLCFRCSSNLVHVWFSVGSGLLQVWIRLG